MGKNSKNNRGEILLCLHHEREIKDLVYHAALCAKDMKARIRLLHVIEVVRSLPLDAPVPHLSEQGERLLQQAQDLVEDEYGLPCETDLLQARAAGPAILEIILERKPTMAIIGATEKRRFGEIFFGSTVEYLLKRSPAKVVIIRPGANGDGG